MRQGFAGVPINALLMWPLSTEAGYRFFRSKRVNYHLRRILSTWGTFLSSPESRACLNEKDGWLSPPALAKLAQAGSIDGASYSFECLYECDPSLPYHDFDSWDAFFTRSFRPGMRPVEHPDLPTLQGHIHPSSAVIVNSCEAAPLQYTLNAQLHDHFWAKSQLYSLADMLHDETHAAKFAGGSVYQAFLSSFAYHRWHSPVSGVVVKTTLVPGTYYSANVHMGFRNEHPDPQAAVNSQPYLSAVATRAVIFIQADHPAIGLMAVVYIGMGDVSSCTFGVGPGDRVLKGETELGSFHHGGSTYVMVFRPSTHLSFFRRGPWGLNAPVYPVNSALARASVQ